jgi:hypothetical protein
MSHAAGAAPCTQVTATQACKLSEIELHVHAVMVNIEEVASRSWAQNHDLSVVEPEVIDEDRHDAFRWSGQGAASSAHHHHRHQK